MPGDQPELEVIIPAGPGERAWKALVAVLPRHWMICISAVESRPPDLPDCLTWQQGPPGRGAQLNLAANASRARWLWFIHADCMPSEEAIENIEKLSESDEECLAYLDLGFLEDGPGLTVLNGWGANLRSRILKLPYGDQGLCLPRLWFQKLGGFRTDLRRGEDLDFVVRARAEGLPLRRVPARMMTSARRYQDQGWLKTSWRHQINAWQLVRSAKARAKSNAHQ
ncbi:MAG TPA: hypothetical protein VKO38_03800 [Wenzhouxiangella sp.]|nr:hypothetical protein [Wenzhouxiangella sp.]